MPKHFQQSFAVRLSLRFMFVLTTALVMLSLCFLFFTGSLVRRSQNSELKNAEEKIFNEIQNQFLENILSWEKIANGENDGLIFLPEIPYYLTYIAYNQESSLVIASNDPFIPLLEDSKGKSRRFFEKDFFYDGNLELLYFAATHQIEEKNIVVAVALNMENNSLSLIFEKLPLALILLAVPILALSFFVSFLISKNTIKPVTKITKTAQSMTTENLSALLPLTGRNDEIDELSKTFNELFLRIKSDFERERQFSSDVSHELNTPLTVISGQANLLLRWGKDNPEQLEKSLTAIKEESKSMHNIISNLLQISRIESGRIKPQKSSVSLDDLFFRIQNEFSTLAPNANLKAESNGIVLNTDEEMLHQLLTIFISNSIKFSEPECHIRVNAWNSEGYVFIEESDDGPGISEKSLPHIFERFYRADESHSRKIEGSGLGLSIAKTLAAALGAEISAKNKNPNGAVFTVQFPAATVL